MQRWTWKSESQGLVEGFGGAWVEFGQGETLCQYKYEVSLTCWERLISERQMKGETEAPTPLETSPRSDFPANSTLPRCDGVHTRQTMSCLDLGCWKNSPQDLFSAFRFYPTGNSRADTDGWKLHRKSAGKWVWPPRYFPTWTPGTQDASWSGPGDPSWAPLSSWAQNFASFLTGAPGAFGPQVCLKTHFF